MEYSSLSALNNAHDNWRIMTRICRLWESTNPQKDDELISIDMILIDEHENLMHATIRKHLASSFKHLLQEGYVYSIRNLKVVPATGNYRPLSCEFKALFLATTSLQRLEEDAANIPLHGFQFVVPDIIETRLNDKTILSDVVGYLSGISDIDIVGNNWKKRDLSIITNHSVTATITLWGKLSEQFDPKFYKDEDEPYVIIVTSTIIKKFKGALCFSSTNNSKIYLNLDIPYVVSLRDRFAHHNKKLKFTESSKANKLTLEEKMFFHRMTVKELVDTAWDADLKEYVATVRGEITGINNEFNWYYVTCGSCEKTAVAKDGLYMCKECEKTIDYPLVMFKVHVYVKDQTGTTTLALFNNVVERLLDTSAKKLFNKYSGDKDVPKEFRTLLGKDLIYKLRLNHYNFKDGYANYSVSEVYEPKESLEHEYKSKKSLQKSNGLEDDLTHNLTKANVQNQKRGKLMMIDDDKANKSDGTTNLEDEEAAGNTSIRDKKKRKIIIMDDEDDNEADGKKN